jgi:hypothetical protein
MQGVTKRAAYVIDQQGIIRHDDILDNLDRPLDMNAIQDVLEKWWRKGYKTVLNLTTMLLFFATRDTNTMNTTVHVMYSLSISRLEYYFCQKIQSLATQRALVFSSFIRQ